MTPTRWRETRLQNGLRGFEYLWRLKEIIMIEYLNKLGKEYLLKVDSGILVGRCVNDDLPFLLDSREKTNNPIIFTETDRLDANLLLTGIAISIGTMESITGVCKNVEVAVLTNNPDKWGDVRRLPYCTGIFPIWDNATLDFLWSVSSWKPKGNFSLIILIDSLEDLEDGVDFEDFVNFEGTMKHGQNRNVHTIAVSSSYNKKGYFSVMRRYGEAFLEVRTGLLLQPFYTNTQKLLEQKDNLPLTNKQK